MTMTLSKQKVWKLLEFQEVAGHAENWIILTSSSEKLEKKKTEISHCVVVAFDLERLQMNLRFMKFPIQSFMNLFYIFFPLTQSKPKHSVFDD